MTKSIFSRWRQKSKTSDEEQPNSPSKGKNVASNEPSDINNTYSLCNTKAETSSCSSNEQSSNGGIEKNSDVGDGKDEALPKDKSIFVSSTVKIKELICTTVTEIISSTPKNEATSDSKQDWLHKTIARSPSKTPQEGSSLSRSEQNTPEQEEYAYQHEATTSRRGNAVNGQGNATSEQSALASELKKITAKQEKSTSPQISTTSEQEEPTSGQNSPSEQEATRSGQKIAAQPKAPRYESPARAYLRKLQEGKQAPPSPLRQSQTPPPKPIQTNNQPPREQFRDIYDIGELSAVDKWHQDTLKEDKPRSSIGPAHMPVTHALAKEHGNSVDHPYYSDPGLARDLNRCAAGYEAMNKELALVREQGPNTDILRRVPILGRYSSTVNMGIVGKSKDGDVVNDLDS